EPDGHERASCRHGDGGAFRRARRGRRRGGGAGIRRRPVHVALAARHDARHRGAGRPGQHEGQPDRRARHRLLRGNHRVRPTRRRLPEGRGGARHHGRRAARASRGSLRRDVRRGALMYLARRAWAQLRNEVLVLPSRTAVLIWTLALLALPFAYADAYVLRVLTMTCIFAIFAASWDLLAGYAGQVNFGHALFFGAGAYTSALMSHKLGITPWATIWAGAAVAALFGFGAGYLCLRLRGSYLSLATLAFP